MTEHPRIVRRRSNVRAEGWFEVLSDWGDQWVKDHCADLHQPDGGYVGPTFICMEAPGYTGLHRDALDRRHTWPVTPAPHPTTTGGDHQ